MITEAWMAEEKVEKGSTIDLAADRLPPSQRPDRKEAIMISLHTADGSTGGMCEIHENPRRAEYSPKMDTIETRFGIQPTAH
jgi:hypothetical protein